MGLISWRRSFDPRGVLLEFCRKGGGLSFRLSDSTSEGFENLAAEQIGGPRIVSGLPTTVPQLLNKLG